MQHAVRVALALPGVVDVDVDVAGVLHAAGDDLVGGVADVLVGDFVGEVVPAVPAHGRRLRHLQLWLMLRETMVKAARAIAASGRTEKRMG